jgi:hypothetical protein
VAHVITKQELDRSLLFCRFSMAAYSNSDPRQIPELHTGQLTCDIRLPPGSQPNSTDTQVLVCRWNSDVVVAFRGTELKLRDLLTDLTGSLVPCEGGVGRVHSGFQSALRSVYPEIIKYVQEIAIPNKSRLFVCGHSLGGALSLLFASRYLRDPGVAACTSPRLAEIFTYGAPRVGDGSFADDFRNLPADLKCFCWVDAEDPVTRMAPASLKYRHAAKRQLIVDKNGWVRHTDIDGLVVSDDDESSLLQRLLNSLQHVTIAASIEASSHKLETSYLHQLLKAQKAHN